MKYTNNPIENKFAEVVLNPCVNNIVMYKGNNTMFKKLSNSFFGLDIINLLI